MSWTLTIEIPEDTVRDVLQGAVRASFTPGGRFSNEGGGAAAIRRQVDAFAIAQDYTELIRERAAAIVGQVADSEIERRLREMIRKRVGELDKQGRLWPAEK